MLDVSEAQLFGLFAEAALWGVLVLTSWQCLVSLLRVSPYQRSQQSGSARYSSKWKDRRDIHWGFFIVNLLFFTAGTVDISIGLRRCLVAFVYFEGGKEAHTIFDNSSDPLAVIKSVNFAVIVLLADIVLIYRCYVVFERNWKVIVAPILIDAGALGGAVFVLYKITSTRNFFVPEVIYVSAVSVGLVTIVNVMMTLMIVWRIWSADKRRTRLRVATDSSAGSTGTKGSPLRRAIKIFVESAALYSVTFIVVVVTYVLNNNSSYIASDMGIQIAGICFDMIMIRINSGRAFSGGSTVQAPQTSSISTGQRRMSTSAFPSPAFGPKALPIPRHKFSDSGSTFELVDKYQATDSGWTPQHGRSTSSLDMATPPPGFATPKSAPTGFKPVRPPRPEYLGVSQGTVADDESVLRYEKRTGKYSYAL